MDLDSVAETVRDVVLDPFEAAQLLSVFADLAEGGSDVDGTLLLLEHAPNLFGTAHPDIIDALALAGYAPALLLRLYGIR